jgi:chromosomal replication initiation ATPase DnaA
VFIEKYSFNREGVRYHKTVTYFLGMVSSMQSETMDDFKDEITEINWVPYHDAKHVLTFPAAQEILNQVFTYLEDSKKAASL